MHRRSTAQAGDSLIRAREVAQKARDLLRQDIDPLVAREQQREAERPAAEDGESQPGVALELTGRRYHGDHSRWLRWNRSSRRVRTQPQGRHRARDLAPDQAAAGIAVRGCSVPREVHWKPGRGGTPQAARTTAEPRPGTAQGAALPRGAGAHGGAAIVPIRIRPGCSTFPAFPSSRGTRSDRPLAMIGKANVATRAGPEAPAGVSRASMEPGCRSVSTI